MTEKFVSLAQEFLGLIESINSLSMEQLLEKCAVILPQLYVCGVQLPSIDIPENESKMDIRDVVKPHEFFPVQEIRHLLKEFDPYMEVFDPIHNKVAIKASLADNLSDIYWKLKLPMMDYISGDSQKRESALWHWKFGMTGHCGDHLVDSMRVIHRLVWSDLFPLEEK